MSEIAIKIYQPFDTGAKRLLAHITNVIDQIRFRAFELSTMHGKEGQNELYDWLHEDANHFIVEVDA